jgi:hypothetical protein
MPEQDNDRTTSEDHFGRHNASKSSTWASVIVIAIIAAIVGAVFYFLR